MRKLALFLVIAMLAVTTTTILAADPEPSSGAAAAPLMEGQSLADALNDWDGYDFTDAGDAFPGALRSGPSADADPDDEFGGDGTIVILPALDEPAHVLLRVRLSEASDPAFWGNIERVMSELAFSPDEQQAVYGGFGQVLGAAYADADDEDQTHDSVVWVANAVALWESTTQGFEATPEGESDPLVPTPMGGVQLEIVPMGQDATVLPMPAPTTAPQVEPTEEPTAEPTPRPTRTPRPTPKPTRKPTATSAPSTGQAPAPGNDDWICDGSEESPAIDSCRAGTWPVWTGASATGSTWTIVSLDRRKPSGENFEVQAMTKVLPARTRLARRSMSSSPARATPPSPLASWRTSASAGSSTVPCPA